MASGIVAGVLTALVAGSFVQAASWSSIHGGMSGMMLAVICLIALVVPPACGFWVGRAIYRWRPQRKTTRMTDSIRLNCPDCGCSMKPSARDSGSAPYIVMECPIHGPFHFGPDTPLTLGRPPQNRQRLGQ